MSSQGWISLHRQIQDNFLWEDKPFSKGQAWIDLLLLAYHEDTKKIYRGELKQYKAGDVHVSIKFLAARWGWGWRKVKRFLVTLELADMVTLNSTTHDTTITIVNWYNFQVLGRTNSTTDSTTDSTTEGRTDSTQSIMINNDNNVNNSADAPRKKSGKKKNYMESWVDALQSIDVEDENDESES